jgi:hypothetical protein
MLLRVRDAHRRKKTDENVTRIKELNHENRYIAIRELANKLVLSFGSYKRILTEDFNHDNDPAHAALSVQEFLAKITTRVVPHSPDLAPCDLLFPKLELANEGKKI